MSTERQRGSGVEVQSAYGLYLEVLMSEMTTEEIAKLLERPVIRFVHAPDPLAGQAVIKIIIYLFQFILPDDLLQRIVLASVIDDDDLVIVIIKGKHRADIVYDRLALVIGRGNDRKCWRQGWMSAAVTSRNRRIRHRGSGAGSVWLSFIGVSRGLPVSDGFGAAPQSNPADRAGQAAGSRIFQASSSSAARTRRPMGMPWGQRRSAAR